MSPQASAPVRVPARAKLNLYLHILGRRDDGYHLIDSLVVFAAVHDMIEVRPATDLTLRVAGRFAKHLATDNTNIVMKAAERLVPLQQDLGTLSGSHYLERLLKAVKRKTVSNDGTDIQAGADNLSHLVPRFEHFPSVDAFEVQAFENHLIPVDFR